MADPDRKPESPLPDPAKEAASFSRKAVHRCEEKVLCERCGAEMFRMHAVWRCPQCRFKTDCCGW
jgi:hypothetical protein